MHINVFARTCQRIFLDEHIPPQNLGTTPQIEVLSHRVWNQRVVLSIKTSDACFARLAYAYYPYLRVRVNGSEQEPRQTAGGFIALKLEKGEHEIVLEPYLSPLRTRLLILNIILLALATFCLFKYRPKTALP